MTNVADIFNPAPSAPADAPAAAAPRPTAVSEDGKVVVTLKGGAGYAAPWIVIHAASVEDANSQLDQPLVDLMERVQKAAAHFAGQEAAAPAGGAASPQRPPAGATEAPDWAPPKPYDDAVYKTGVSKKTGKTWHAWMPPQQGDPREPKFFYPN